MVEVSAVWLRDPSSNCVCLFSEPGRFYYQKNCGVGNSHCIKQLVWNGSRKVTDIDVHIHYYLFDNVLLSAKFALIRLLIPFIKACDFVCGLRIKIKLSTFYFTTKRLVHQDSFYHPNKLSGLVSWVV